DYLQKSALYPPLIESIPSAELGLSVVIPCFDEPALLTSLQSLQNCVLPNSKVEVIVVINCSEGADNQIINQNRIANDEAAKFALLHSTNHLKFYIFNLQFPPKHSGVGLARKVGMDEAVRRFEVLNKDGIIVCFDADSQCDSNYLVEIEKAFKANPLSPGASIYFEHPIEGSEFSDQIYEGIIQYELYLRYYCNALKWAGHPHAFQTIGSSMAVKSKVYQAQGGMNKRKAGEDFYFLEKIIPLGNFIEINSTKVVPSPRPSHRVPFGTGKAVSQWLETRSDLTHNLLIFRDLKLVFESIPLLYHSKNDKEIYDKFPVIFQKFVDYSAFETVINELVDNTNSFSAFNSRFFRWFNLFRVLKFVHFCDDEVYGQVPIDECVRELMVNLQMNGEATSQTELLLKLRRYDRQTFK
ncbi:MAG: glycosyltransferase, partial [Cytophagales bacterium]